MKYGLVMEGGAMRGMFTAGVTDVLMENNIEFDGAIGVSAGATFGCNFKSKQPGRAIRYCKRFADDKRFCSVTSLIKTGDMFGVDFCYHEIPQKLDAFDYKTYRENKMPFYMVMTDIKTGKPVYVNVRNCDGENIKYMQASASMPLASQPVKIKGNEYLDGGVTDSIPLRFMEREGYGKNVVILTQPKGYKKSPSKLMKVISLYFHKYPNLVKAMKRRHLMYNNETKYVSHREKEGRAFVIQPKEKLPTGRVEHDSALLEAAYNEGRRAAEERLEALKKFIGK